MIIHAVHDIIRKNPLIAYRREYSAQATVSYLNKSPQELGIEFSLELSPLGTSQIRVKLISHPDFPSLSLLTMLKEHIRQLDHNGSLP